MAGRAQTSYRPAGTEFTVNAPVLELIVVRTGPEEVVKGSRATVALAMPAPVRSPPSLARIRWIRELPVSPTGRKEPTIEHARCQQPVSSSNRAFHHLIPLFD